jgi:hypothetical protein
MTELSAQRTDKVFKELAASGKYLNTGKVLIGVAYVPRAREMSYGEERIQSALLKGHGPRITAGTWGYMALIATASVAALVACSV